MSIGERTCLLLPAAARFAIASGESILTAALRARVPIPFCCSTGNCAACKLAVLSGDVAHTVVVNPAVLSPAEEGLGTVLACRAVARSDVVVLLLSDDRFVFHPERDFESRIERARRLSADTDELELTLPDPPFFSFSPGQFAFVDVGGRASTKTFFPTPASSSQLTLHLRHRTTHAPGAIVRVRGPYGKAFLRERFAGPTVVAGFGRGRMALLAILQALAIRQPVRQLAAFIDEDTYTTPRLRDIRVRQPHWSFFPVTSLDDRSQSFAGCKAYTMGPPGFVARAVRMFADTGVARADIHAEVC